MSSPEGHAGHGTRVAMWSGPRNVSTAMMRSWENREDTVVVDEPFYAAYLLRTGIDHPGREAVIASQPTDPGEVVSGLHGPLPDGATVHYAKQMTHHLADDADLSWTRDFRNVLLIRDPAEVVASYVRSRESCEPEDIGLLQQVRLLDALRSGDEAPPVIDAGDFLRDPEGYLRWPAGPRDSDGVWAPYWYDAVARSTGFEAWHPREIDLSPHDAGVAETCRPAYDALYARRLRLP